MYQLKYWRELQQLKENLNYIQLYLEKLESTDRAFKIFLAITSSGSIAGWAIWKNLSLLWAIIIASSQVINVIKPFLPYEARLKSLFGLFNALENLMLSTEDRWYDVSEGKLTEKEIHDLQMEVKRKKVDAIIKNLGNNLLPHKESIYLEAVRSADVYFNNFYNNGGNNGQ